MVRWTLQDTLAFLLLLSLLLPSLLIMFIPSTFKRPVSSWKALNLRKTLLMASSVRLKPLNCSRLPCVYAQETLTFLLDRKSGSAGMPRPNSYAVFCLKKKKNVISIRSLSYQDGRPIAVLLDTQAPAILTEDHEIVL